MKKRSRDTGVFLVIIGILAMLAASCTPGKHYYRSRQFNRSILVAPCTR